MAPEFDKIGLEDLYGGERSETAWTTYSRRSRLDPRNTVNLTRPLPWVDVRAYATGDGSTDDTAAIQACLDDYSDGGCIVFSPGTYIITDALQFHGNQHLMGTGPHSIIKNSDSRTSGSNQFTMMQPYADSITNITISDLTFDANFTTLGHESDSKCITINRNVDYITIQRCTFRDVIQLAVHSGGPGKTINFLKILDSTIEQSAGGGFSLFRNLFEFTIANNTIRKTQENAVGIQMVLADEEYPKRGVIANNVFREIDTSYEKETDTWTTPSAIYLYGAKDVSVTGNAVWETYSTALMITDGSENISVTGNTINLAGTTGVRANHSDLPQDGIGVYGWTARTNDITITGNTVTGSQDNGIHIDQVDRVVISGNTFSENGNNGIFIAETSGKGPSEDITITGNNLMDNGTDDTEAHRAGIAMGACGYVTIIGNRIGNSDLGGTDQQRPIIMSTGESPAKDGYNDIVIMYNNVQNNANDNFTLIQDTDIIVKDNWGDAWGICTDVFESGANVADPPTQAQLNATFGTPGTDLSRVPDGFVGLINDNNGDTAVWVCVVSNGAWFSFDLMQVTSGNKAS